MGFVRFLPEGLNLFKIQTRFKVHFASESYNSKSREILELGRKETLFHFKFYINMPGL
jgi:hypothetical protein